MRESARLHRRPWIPKPLDFHRVLYYWAYYRVKKDIHILMLEDDKTDAELTKFALQKGDLSFSLARVETREDYVKALDRHPPAVILSDYSLPGFNGHEALKIALEKCPETPFIFVTGTMGEEVAIETLKGGATDYVLKHRLSRLLPAVNRALREAADRAEHRRAEIQLRESHEQLRALSVYLQTVREEERTRIAREVHDELGQALTSCKLELSWLASRLPPELKPLVQKTRALASHIDSTIQTVRRISSELRPGILDHLGLNAALEEQANEFQNRTGIRCDVTADLDDAPLEQNLSTTFFRIFQETLTNIIRHAGATRVAARIWEADGQINLQVEDNGRGISKSESTQTSSMGLLGMRERAALLGGAFKIGRVASGKGTRVTVTIPVPKRATDTSSNGSSTDEPKATVPVVPIPVPPPASIPNPVETVRARPEKNTSPGRRKQSGPIRRGRTKVSV